MPNGFTPADRETVRETAESTPWVFDAEPAGPGVMVVAYHGNDDPRSFTTLTERHGWYVDKYRPAEGGDWVLLMPITEVNAP